ncbi:hypothetical protein PspLS_08252 [Pyricularia sp. CBS 133598]|nr:hypothetical protein PspLS_08252 [Pyricularia sp. CBS 133598]
MFEILFRPAVAAPLVLLACYIIYNFFLKPSQLPDLPIAGAREGDWFPYWQAKWRNTMDAKNALKSAYRQFKDQPYRLPSAGGMGETVVLPKEWTNFVMSQSDDVLNLYEQGSEFFQLDHTFLDSRLHHPPVHVDLIARDLTKQIGNLVTEMEEETRLALDQEWGGPDDWTDIRVYDTVQTMVGMVSARVAYGKNLCRDPRIFQLSMEFVHRAFICGLLLHFTYIFLRPILAPLVTIPIYITLRKFRKLVVPEIRRRLADWDGRHADLEKQQETSGSEAPPNDYLQWAIRQAKELGDPYFWKETVLAGRLLILNFVSIHTSSFSLTHVIMDLASCNPSVMEELRDEITSVLAEHGGAWSKKALNKMEKLDSTLRESSRLNSFVTFGSNRLIVSPQGLTLPNGQTLPRGVGIILQAYPVLHDEAIYPDAGTFKPFRFAEARHDESVDYVQRARNAFATTSPDYLAFGHGRHACPGRFFAATELKLLLAHMLLDYDIEAKQRPRNKWYGISRVPDMEATVRIRRRKKV